MSPLLAGLTATLPLVAEGLLVMLFWGARVQGALKDGGMDMSPMSDAQMRWLLMAMFALTPLMFGLLAGVVYGWMQDAALFLVIALGLALLFSVAAVVLRTPWARPKIGANFAVALVIGLLLPPLV